MVDRPFAMVAGETSGDLLAGLLIDGLKARWPTLRMQGIGGPAMQAHGFDSWWPQEKLAVRGYIEVLPRLWEILSIRRQLRKRLIGVEVVHHGADPRTLCGQACELRKAWRAGCGWR